MKFLIKFASIFLLGFSSYSQNSLNSEELTINWLTLHTQNDIELQVRKSPCDLEGVPKEFTYGFIKIINSTSEDIEIQFSIELDYTDGCTGCDSPNEDVRTVLVKANSSIDTDCSVNNNLLSFLINNPYQLDHKNLVKVRLVGFKTL